MQHWPGGCARTTRRTRSTRLSLEPLESRLLLSASPADPYRELLSHGGICNCPICSGRGLEAIAPQAAVATNASASLAAAVTPTGVPQLSSRAGAAATLFLDFNGHAESRWGEFTNVVTPAYDTDGNAASFSAAEIAAIREIWSRVAEDYAPFNINVTTVAPPVIADRVSVRMAIGGNYSDWFGSSAGGVAYVGGFSNGAPNVGYIFENALSNGNPLYTAEAVSHEAGHLFGLSHQAQWSGSQLVNEYHTGTATWAPIMGVGYYSDRTTWTRGATSSGPGSIQDDLSILAGAANGFGYVADDFGSTTTAAAALPVGGGTANVSGLIGRDGDRDYFKFTTGGGTLNLTLTGAQHGANLDGALDLLGSAGQTLLSASPAGSLGATLSKALAAGTYYVVVRASGGYGNLGRYTLRGSVPGGTTTPQPPASPEVSVSISGAEVSKGGLVSFGNTSLNAAVSRTITIKNVGGGSLSVSPLAAALPSGYTLVSNVGATKLLAGQSTSITVRLDAQRTGTFGGALNIVCGDADEGTFKLNLSGAVQTAVASTAVRIMDNGTAGFAASGGWASTAGAGYTSDLHWAGAGQGGAVASWTFTGLSPGQYRVAATWPGSQLYSASAPFSIYNGSQLKGTVRVNQQRAASTFADAGAKWQNLGTFAISGTSVTVRLTNAATGRVIADAVRLERVYSTSGGTALGGEILNDAAVAELARLADGLPLDLASPASVHENVLAAGADRYAFPATASAELEIFVLPARGDIPELSSPADAGHVDGDAADDLYAELGL